MGVLGVLVLVSASCRCALRNLLVRVLLPEKLTGWVDGRRATAPIHTCVLEIHVMCWNRAVPENGTPPRKISVLVLVYVVGVLVVLVSSEIVLPVKISPRVEGPATLAPTPVGVIFRFVFSSLSLSFSRCSCILFATISFAFLR